MGNTESSVPDAEDYRLHNAPIKLPMPEPKELNAQFEQVLGSMDLSPDKIKVLVNYDNDKKWELICDQDKVLIKNPPQYYIDTLLSYLDPSLRSKRFRRRIANSTKTLRELEISLRTNHIGWVREFLNEENCGLDVLVDYLAFAQLANTYGGVIPPAHNNLLATSKSSNSTGDLSLGYGSSPSINKRSSVASTLSRNRNNSLPNRRTLKNSQVIVDRDDVHVCISCLRTIMNYQHGFRLVTSHPQCVNAIALSLNNKSLRTKSLVLELLAAVCLVEGGHEIILRAFNNFKVVCTEPRRFSKLMQYFKAETENIDFLVSCTQFINIVVHSVEDMNFRVHLQYEFTMLGLDEYLETLRLTESDRLKVQIQAYLDNMFDVSALLEDSELKVSALERVESLEDQVLTLNEKIQEQEYENMTTIVELEKQLSAKNTEITEIKDPIAPAFHRPNIPRPPLLQRLNSIGESTPQTPESREIRDQSAFPAEYIVPVGMTPTSDGLGWRTLGNGSQNRLDELDPDLARRSVVLIPAEVWQDLEKRNFAFHPSPSVSSFASSSSTSGSSGFTTDSSFQWQKTRLPNSSYSANSLKNSDTIKSNIASSDGTQSYPGSLDRLTVSRKPGLHRQPRFYIDGEDYMDFNMPAMRPRPERYTRKRHRYINKAPNLTDRREYSSSMTNMSEHHPKSPPQESEWSSSSSDTPSAKTSPEIINRASEKLPSNRSKEHKKHNKVSRKDYAVLPNIPSKSRALNQSRSHLPNVDASSRALPSLGENAPQLPTEIGNDYIENLPHPPASLLFNKNLVLPPLGPALEERLIMMSQSSSSSASVVSNSSGSRKSSSSGDSSPAGPPSRPKPPPYAPDVGLPLGTIYEVHNEGSPARQVNKSEASSEVLFCGNSSVL